MRRDIRNSVVVITGASSGIGRATALAFARRGATVMLVARREEPLTVLLTECEHLAARCLAIQADVTDQAALQAVARRAVDAFGRIDTWVNNAGVMLFARFEDAPAEAYRRVIDTNLFGYIHGVRAVLPYFRKQRAGVLINTVSMIAVAPQPYLSAYAISEHGIRGLGLSLREELEADGLKDIHVCAVMAGTFDTPLVQHAANYTGRPVHPHAPILPAERVAETIVRLARTPRPETHIGHLDRGATRLAVAGEHHAAKRREWSSRKPGGESVPPTAGNLFTPMPEYAAVSGGWIRPRRRLGRRALPWFFRRALA